MNRVPKKITVRMLERMGACVRGIDSFRRVFGESAEFVPGNVYHYLAESGVGMGMLLERIDKRIEDRAFWKWHKLDTAPCAYFYAAALCRLARQNVRRKAGAK